ncbi:probable F-box protein At2g36090, partial [Phalaenopsis equestris]|uniref:probable F-box protein At2g36090 n=1 Tax=Phalaenopsis equestris TaxID=78828 RepID=UPI0009E301A8
MNEIHGDILMQALGHLDGPSLASASCASSHLRSLASHPDLWRRLCLSTWPSLNHPLHLPLLNSSPRIFFSDAHPFPASSSPSHNTNLPDKLISAVDLYHRGVPIFSRVIETDTSTSWFRNSAFLIDAPSATGAVSPKDLTLSWIVIDPAKGRAVNLSSRRAVAVEKRDWCVGETVARFATVREGLAVGAVVMWRKERWWRRWRGRGRGWERMRLGR